MVGSPAGTGTEAGRAVAPPASGVRRLPRGWLGPLGTGAVAVVLGVVVWDLLAIWVDSALFLPSPLVTYQAAVELWDDGTLGTSIVASMGRILAGWMAGLVVGIPLGVLMGSFRPLRHAIDPYIEFFRFIPPIAFVTLAIIWLGPGEASKVALIFYTTVFIITLNAIAGVMAVSELRVRAAASLGASRRDVLLTVVLPSIVPHLVTGARIAIGNSFLTIVSAEIVSAQVGLGALIWTARNYGRTEWVFVGIIALGILGFVVDRIIRLLCRQFLKRYDVMV